MQLWKLRNHQREIISIFKALRRKVLKSLL
jgi:hypothetical protein